jgi:hypothetical protein
VIVAGETLRGLHSYLEHDGMNKTLIGDVTLHRR